MLRWNAEGATSFCSIMKIPHVIRSNMLSTFRSDFSSDCSSSDPLSDEYEVLILNAIDIYLSHWKSTYLDMKCFMHSIGQRKICKWFTGIFLQIPIKTRSPPHSGVHQLPCNFFLNFVGSQKYVTITVPRSVHNGRYSPTFKRLVVAKLDVKLIWGVLCTQKAYWKILKYTSAIEDCFVQMDRFILLLRWISKDFPAFEIMNRLPFLASTILASKKPELLQFISFFAISCSLSVDQLSAAWRSVFWSVTENYDNWSESPESSS